jgi:signal transduction histidine kinase
MTQLGLEVDLIVEGEKAGVPPSVDTAAYRIVREALTNTLKHSGPVAATVRLRVDTKALYVEVSDTGGGSHPSPPGSGHGLIGIRQRVAMYGGELSVGHTDDGGFLLEVTLPLDGER